MSRGLAFLVLALACSGCVADDSTTGETAQPIIGGTETTLYPEVVHLATSAGGCTATLVAPRLVLTASHCVISGSGPATGGTVRFGSGFGDFFAARAIERNLPHRQYAFGAVTRFDIAFARLDSDAPVELTPYSINLDPLDDQDIGRPVQVVGFGVTDGAAQTGAGTKRQVTLSIDELTTQHIGYGSPLENICQGDSGGPTLVFGGATPMVLAVSSFGSDQCRARSYVARTDAFPDFVQAVVSAWGDGPCAEDGSCNAACSDFLDPDCGDTCSLDGVCGSGCVGIDLDCPVGGLIGDFCESDDDCESRLCIAAIDDPRIKYCSEVCDPENEAVPDCQVPLTCDGSQCRYVLPTPSAQGSRCDEARDCRSGICDFDNEICVGPCGADSDCSEEYACGDVAGQKACTVPVEGGCLGCGFSRGWPGSGEPVLLLFAILFGYGAALRRRRLRPGSH